MESAPRLDAGPGFTVTLPPPPKSDTLRVGVYGRCFFTHSGLGLRRFRLLEETKLANTDLERAMTRYAIAKYFTQRRVRATNRELLVLHNHWSSGYYHWLSEVLVKLAVINTRTYDVVLPEDYPPFASQSLGLFEFRDVFRLPRGRALSASRVTIVSNPLWGRYSPARVRWLRQSLAPRCGATDGPSERVYITRRHATMRHVENEDEVSSLVKQYGFRVVDTAALSFCEQVRLFSRCSALVSVHGAGMTNCVFMPAGSQVLELHRELTAEAPGMNTSYWNLSTAADLRYLCQFCAHGQNEGDHVDRINVVVDIDRLRHNLEVMARDDGR